MGRISKICKCLLLIIALILIIFLLWSFLVWAGVLAPAAGTAGGWAGAMATAGRGIASNLGWVAGAASLGAYALSPGTFKDGLNQAVDDVGDLAKRILLSPLLWLAGGAFALYMLAKDDKEDGEAKATDTSLDTRKGSGDVVNVQTQGSGKQTTAASLEGGTNGEEPLF